MKNYVILGFLFCLLTVASFSSVSAASYTNTLFNATNATTNNSVAFNLSGTAEIDKVTLNNVSIIASFENISYTIGGANFTVALLNLTTKNSTTFSYSLPNVSSVTDYGVSFVQGYASTLSVNVTVTTNGNIPVSPMLTKPDGSTEFPTYTYDAGTGKMTFVSTFQSGTTTLSYVTQNGGACYDFSTTERMLFVTGLLAGLVFFAYIAFQNFGSLGGMISSVVGIVIFVVMLSSVIMGMC